MPRRKPSDVRRHAQQLKRQRQALDEANDLLLTSREASNPIEIVDLTGDAPRLVKKRKGGENPRISARNAVRDGNGVLVNAASRALSFVLSREDRDGSEWDDALWIKLPVRQVDRDTIDEAIESGGVPASNEFVKQVAAAIQENQDDPVGLELAANSQTLTMVLLGEDDITKKATALTSRDAFPGVHATWLTFVLDLVERKLLTLELELIDDENSSRQMLCWSAGICWRTYNLLCQTGIGGRAMLPLAPIPRKGLHMSMHRVMLWLLKHSWSPLALQCFGRQCSYDYRDEIELLYNRFVGYNELEIEKIGAHATTAISDLHARINVRKHAGRDVSKFDTAIERANNRYHKISGSDESLLVPTLRPYQQAAVSWMLEREQFGLDSQITGPTRAIELNVTFSEAKPFLKLPSSLTYDPHCAAFVDWSAPTFESAQPRFYEASSVFGGILADEMGLGKTVEVISLVLCHPSPSTLPALLEARTTIEVDDAEHEINDARVKPEMVMDCICGTQDDHELGLVCCDLCGTWHHQICSGYAATSSRPHGVWTLESSPGSETPFDFMCFHCQIRDRPMFSSKTTLIVSPESIHDQWESEIKRHVRSPEALTLLRYPGVKELRNRLRNRPSAEWQLLSTAGLQLSTYDIVLTTYEALQSDIYYLPTPEGRDRRSSMRQTRKKYAFIASPLVFLEFWRVCMDEAQVGVESTTAKVALTIAQLRARSTWVVTGTPFSKSSSISDLFGYLKFLCVEPFASGDEAFFRGIVADTFSSGAIDRVLDLMLWDGVSKIECGERRRDGGGLLWRTSKRDVLDQLHLPSQRSVMVWCRFSKVERHYYEQQERAIVSLVRQRINLNRQPEGDAATNAVIDGRDRIWHDLLELRKICCHPQVGSRFGVVNGSGAMTLGGRRLATDAVLTMDEFLRELITRKKRECEEAQRKLVAARNGLAAMRLLPVSTEIQDEEVEMGAAAAIQEYLAAIELVQTNWPLFRADLLPRLHILENLARCCRQHFNLEATSITEVIGSVDAIDFSDNNDSPTTQNPKENHLLPQTPTLKEKLSTLTDRGSLEAISVTSEERRALQLEHSQLERSAAVIREFYLLQVENSHAVSKRNFKELQSKVISQITSKKHTTKSKPLLCTVNDRDAWWSDALALVEQANDREHADRLVARIHARLAAFGTKWSSRFCGQLVSCNTLRLQLLMELEELATRRQAVYTALKKLSVASPSREQVQRSGNCRKCRDNGTGPICDHCKLYKELDGYRQHVLGIDRTASGSTFVASGMNLMNDDDDDDDDDEQSEHYASDKGAVTSPLIVEVFKEIAASARVVVRSEGHSQNRLSEDSHGFTPDDISARLHRETELFGLILREWNIAKKLFHAQHQRLGALDELEMASSQIRLRVDGEARKTATEKLYIIDAFEVPTRFAELQADRAIADQELRDTLSQLRFLLQLASDSTKKMHDNVESSSSSTSSARECAVCLQETNGTRAMLLCAHSFCRKCVETLAKRRNGLTVKCPTCRHVTPLVHVTVVNEHQSPVSRPISTTPSSGNGLGSKMDALLDCVRKLVDRDPGVKCLLFSQWYDMLRIVSSRLDHRVDGLSCFVYSSKREFPMLLRDFKTCPRACVLALPFAIGANGLNIVEATEVLLVEPHLNASTEAQAINRVHRIGQTRPTHVHRFIVETTVEERIHWLGKTRQQLARARLHSNEEEHKEEEEDDDDDTTGAVGGARAQAEKLTIRDLHVLLDGTTSHFQNGNSEVAIEPSDRFWLVEKIVHNTKPKSRDEAFRFSERRLAMDARDRGGDTQRNQLEPTTRLFGRDIRLLIADELLGLPSVLENEGERDLVMEELVAVHRARVKEELATWRVHSQV